MCRSDLGVDIYLQDLETEPWYVIGSTPSLVLGAVVANKEAGEPAYNPALRLRYPATLHLKQMISNCVEKNTDSEDRNSERTLVCKIPGPLFPGNSYK